VVDTTMSDTAPGWPGEMTGEQVARVVGSLVASVGPVTDGKPEAVRSTLVCLLAEGHLLIDEVAGVGGTRSRTRGIAPSAARHSSMYASACARPFPLPGARGPADLPMVSGAAGGRGLRRVVD